MPRRVRHDRRRHARLALTPRRGVALMIGPSPVGDEPDELLAAVYVEHREHVIAATPAHVVAPWGWWAFEPGVPDELRGTRLGLVTLEGAEQHRAEQDALEAARAAWLATV